MANKLNKGEPLLWVIAAVVLVGAAIGLCVFLAKKDNFKTTAGPGVQGLLTITPEKACSMGPYMTQSGPHHEYCKKLWSTPEGRRAISHYTCMNGDCQVADGMQPAGKNLKGEPLPGNPYGVGQFNGMPLYFERTPMSNAMWNNEMCCPPVLQKDHPQVL